MKCNVSVNPVHTLATLDDDLYGTRAGDNQVKSINSRKADQERHTADSIADAFFRITLMVRFRRRGGNSLMCDFVEERKTVRTV